MSDTYIVSIRGTEWKRLPLAELRRGTEELMRTGDDKLSRAAIKLQIDLEDVSDWNGKDWALTTDGGKPLLSVMQVKA